MVRSLRQCVHALRNAKKPQPVPNLPVWTWLFDSEHSPLRKHAPSAVKGFTNAKTKEHLSYADVAQHSTHISTALVKDYGLKSNQTVALFSQNSVWYPTAMFGILRAGGVVSGASPAYNVEEMTYALKTADAKFLMTMPSSMNVAAEAARSAGIPKSNVFLLEGEMEGFTTMKQLLEKGRKHAQQIEAFRIPAGKKNSDICGYLSFSSGTTGLPKAVMIAHSNVMAQCLQVQQLTPPEQDKILAVLPLFHITGLVHQMHLPVLLNANVYMLPSFSMEGMLDTVCEYKIQEMLLVPPIIIRLVRDEETLKKYDLKHLRRFSSGAAPLSAEILQLLEKRFPGTGFKQGYGMTESCSCITAHPPQFFGFEYAHRVGTVVASTTVKIVDPDSGRECGYDEPGEIWAKGPQIVMGYLNNEKATRETFDQDGYLHTGDIGSMDREGLITITDRLKEMIKVKGIGVAPAELEDLLLGHEDVEDVAVLGKHDDYAGERPKAYVVLKPHARRGDVQVTGKGLIKYVQDKKVRHKWLAEIAVVDEIPKSASGKILRRVLRDMDRKGSTGVVVKDDRERARL